jgi:NADH dehydrogenase FAD-containing subunit
MKNIIILGGSYAGISTAHRILKQAPKTELFKITLVSPDTHFYWNMASPRAVVPGKISDDEIFRPIAPGFKPYPASQFEFLVASATSLNVEEKTVRIAGLSGDETLHYDYLVIATGSRTKADTPFKSLGSTEDTKQALHELQARVKTAKTIVIAGAGITGCEVAGELATGYESQKEVILLVKGDSVLDSAPGFVQKHVLKDLQNLKVDVRINTTVSSVLHRQTGGEELSLSDGSKLVVDLYVPTFGVKPNSSYIPSNLLNDNGYVMVDDCLQVHGAKDIWAVGDVSDAEWLQFIFCDRQSTHVAKTLVAIIGNKVSSAPYKRATTRMMGLSVGQNAGAGHWGNFQIPTFLIKYMRKTLFLENMGKTVDGTMF